MTDKATGSGTSGDQVGAKLIVRGMASGNEQSRPRRSSVSSVQRAMSCCSDPQLVHVLPLSNVSGWLRVCLNCAYESEPGIVRRTPDPADPPEAC